jgi:hypothetical protein
MGCLSILLNILLPGLGTLIFTPKRVQGFIQLVLTIFNGILVFATLGLWGIFGGFIHLGLLVWSIVATTTFMSEQTAKRVVREHLDNENK